MELHRSKKVLGEAWILIFITKLFGLFPLDSCRSKCGRFVYPVVVIILYYGCYGYAAEFAFNFYKELEVTSYAGAMRRNGYCFNVVYLPAMIIPSIYHSRKVQVIYDEIGNINKGFEYLNIRFDHKLRMRRHTVHVLSVMFVTIIFNLVDYYALCDDDSGAKFVLMWIIGGIPEFVNSLVICHFAILSQNIASMLGETNEVIDSLTHGRSGRNSPTDVDEVFRVKMIIVHYVKLCKITTLTNDAFGFQLTLSFVIYFMRIFLHLYFICSNTNSGPDLIDVLTCGLWVMFDIGKFVYIYTRKAYNTRNGESSKYIT